MLHELLHHVPNRDRTCGLSVNSRMLYRLSYRNQKLPQPHTRSHPESNQNILCQKQVCYHYIMRPKCSTSCSKCSLRGSNSRLSAHKTDALPTELSERKTLTTKAAYREILAENFGSTFPKGGFS